MVKTPEFPLQGRQVQSLIGELRSCIMTAMWPKKKKKTFKEPPFISVTCQILCKAFPPGDLHGFSTQTSGRKTHQSHFQMKKQAQLDMAWPRFRGDKIAKLWARRLPALNSLVSENALAGLTHQECEEMNKYCFIHHQAFYRLFLCLESPPCLSETFSPSSFTPGKSSLNP